MPPINNKDEENYVVLDVIMAFVARDRRKKMRLLINQMLFLHHVTLDMDFNVQKLYQY